MSDGIDPKDLDETLRRHTPAEDLREAIFGGPRLADLFTDPEKFHEDKRRQEAAQRRCEQAWERAGEELAEKLEADDDGDE